MHILVVEDDVALTRKIASALIEAGHDPVVTHDGEAALQKGADKSFDLIVLDVGLPRMDGFEVLRHLRTKHVNSRVLMLTARGAVEDRITGLQLGADDYLPKPFAMRELVARVRALGRRYAEEPTVELRVDDLTLDLVNHVVHRGERRIDLSARTHVAKCAHARARPRLYPHRTVRAGLGARSRIRHETGRSLHRAVAKKDWRSAADLHRPPRGLYDPRTIMIPSVPCKVCSAERAAEAG
jgi:CheY-like chemotaxis protein